jgi:hypothetical protein
MKRFQWRSSGTMARLTAIFVTVLVPYFILVACDQGPARKVERIYIESAIPNSLTADVTHGQITIASTWDTSQDLTGYELRSVTTVSADTVPPPVIHYISYFPEDSSIDANSSLVIDQTSALSVVVYELADSDVTIYLKDASLDIIDVFQY